MNDNDNTILNIVILFDFNIFTFLFNISILYFKKRLASQQGFFLAMGHCVLPLFMLGMKCEIIFFYF